MTPARLAALKLAESDVVLLVAKRGTYGSTDTRREVRRPTVMWLVQQGYLQIDITHGDDMADGFRLTNAGRAAIAKATPQGAADHGR